MTEVFFVALCIAGVGLGFAIAPPGAIAAFPGQLGRMYRSARAEGASEGAALAMVQRGQRAAGIALIVVAVVIAVVDLLVS